MKVKISKEEYYPIYVEEEEWFEYEVEIPEELWKRYLKALDEFKKLKAEVGVIVDGWDIPCEL